MSGRLRIYILVGSVGTHIIIIIAGREPVADRVAGEGVGARGLGVAGEDRDQRHHHQGGQHRDTQLHPHVISLK